MLRYSIGATDPVWGELMKQITRLEQLDGFPFGPEAKKDLGAALAHSESLDEAKLVIDEFVQDARAGQKCPLAGDITGMIETRLRRRNPESTTKSETAVAQVPRGGTHCARCGGFGYFGGYIGGGRDSRWEWCDCPNARRVRYESPKLVDQANAVRDKLIRKTSAPIPRDLKRATTDAYHGEF